MIVYCCKNKRGKKEDKRSQMVTGVSNSNNGNVVQMKGNNASYTSQQDQALILQSS